MTFFLFFLFLVLLYFVSLPPTRHDRSHPEQKSVLEVQCPPKSRVNYHPLLQRESIATSVRSSPSTPSLDRARVPPQSHQPQKNFTLIPQTKKQPR